MKWIWFIPTRDGRFAPVYFRKAYKKARVKRQSERMSPGFWDRYVKHSTLCPVTVHQQ